MECNKEEAARAKSLAERKMVDNDFVGAKKMILKAQQLSKELDNISQQMLAVCDVHSAAGAKVNGEIDWYGILQLPVNADDAQIKKQYRRLAFLLHPDKNKFAGAEAAFKLVGEANMTLIDRSKRSVYDMKRNTSVRVSMARHSRPAPNRASGTPVNLYKGHQQQQQQAPNSAGSQQTFWTSCPSCGMRYQYYLSILKKALRCQNCLKPFIAHDVNEPAVPSGANQRSAGVWKNAGAPQNVPPSQANVPGKAAWSSTPGFHVNPGSHHANVNRKRNTDGNAAEQDQMKPARAKKNPVKASSTAGRKRGRRKAVVESSVSSGSDTTSDSEGIVEQVQAANTTGPGQQTRRSSRQRQEVKYNEESDEDDIEVDSNKDDENIASPPSLKRLRKTGLFHRGHGNETTKLNEDGNNGPTNSVNDCSNAEDKNKDSAPCGEQTFSRTQQMNRETMQAGENSDGKEKVFHSVSGNGIDPNNGDSSNDDKFDDTTFTVVDPEFFDFDQLRDASQFRPNQIWAVNDDDGCMPRFYARITKVKATPNFLVHFVWLEFDPKNEMEAAWHNRGLPVACGHYKHGKSDTSKEAGMFSRTISLDKSKRRSMYEIYPRKGEVWALFKGWNISWSLDVENHNEYQYEVVQVLSDLTTSTSIIVMPLVKIKGFVSLFIQSKDAAPYVIPQGETLRFSHCVPHHLMNGAEREGVPEGSLELDPAGLPHKFEESFPSVALECSLAKGPHKGSMSARERVDTTCMNAETAANTSMEETSEHKMGTAGFTDADEDDICNSEYVNAEAEFHKFSESRLLQKFSVGQIWALYSDVDKFPNYYALINKVDLKNSRIQVRWLDACPQGEEDKRLLQEGHTIACGTFKLSDISDVMTYSNTDAFSHPVEARATGKKGEYEIIPNFGEIWAIYRNWRTGWTVQDYEKCEYELVEIFGHTDSSTQVKLLRKVDGYNTVFMPYKGGGSVKSIRKDEYPKFSHQIPCFHLTHEGGGKLRGCLELDPFSLPEQFLISNSK